MTLNRNGLTSKIHYSGFVSLCSFLLISSSLGALVPEAEVKLSKHPVVIVISYDGFRYDYLNKTDTPNLHRVKASGVSVPHMDNQFLTYTFPNHHSIATGLFIESHGVVANRLYDPVYGRELSGYDNEPGFWNYSSEVLPLYTVNELAGDGRVSGVMMWPGSGEPWGEQETYATHLVLYNKSVPYEERVDTVMSWITDESQPANLVFLYFEEPDSTGHTYGPEGSEIINAIKRMDDVTGYILEQLEDLGIEDKVNLVFLSDHGMQEIKPKYRVPYRHIVDTNQYDNHGGTPVMQILPKNPADTQRIFDAFKAEADKENSHFNAYLKSDLAKVKPHWHYNNRRVMPILLVVEPEYAFLESYNDGDTSGGAHGFDNAHHTMWPYFMAHGPLFKVNKEEKVFSNVDVYPLICHIMNMSPPPNNGSLAKTLPLLRSSAIRTSWMGSTGGTVIGILGGAAVISLLVGFLVFKHRQAKRDSIDLTCNG